jgi:hypothetical protein
MTLQPDSEVNIPRTPDLPDFSLALGGPLFQIYRRMHPSGDTLELLRLESWQSRFWRGCRS